MTEYNHTKCIHGLRTFECHHCNNRTDKDSDLRGAQAAIEVPIKPVYCRVCKAAALKSMTVDGVRPSLWDGTEGLEPMELDEAGSNVYVCSEGHTRTMGRS